MQIVFQAQALKEKIREEFFEAKLPNVYYDRSHIKSYNF